MKTTMRNYIQVLMTLLIFSSLLSGNEKIKRSIAEYESKKKSLDEKYAKDLLRESKKVIDDFNYEIKKLTRKGDLEAANDLLSRKKAWEKETSKESPVAIEKNEEALREVKNQGEFKYSLKHHQLWTYTKHPGNKVDVTHVLCSHKSPKIGSKLKIVGTYEIGSHEEGLLSIIPNGTFAGEKPSSVFKKGKGNFMMEGVYLKDEDLKMSIYPKNESGVGQIMISF